MIRRSLDDVPQYVLPAPYRVVWYRPGCEEWWRRIQTAADRFNTIGPDLFEVEFGTDEALLSQRQCFLLDERGVPFATATAWFNDDYGGRPFGRVHWVAIVPEMQGRGLSKPLLTLVCNRLRELGHERAYLTTSTARIPAINLYLKFGFVPEIRTASDAALWRVVMQRLARKSGRTNLG